MCVFLKAEETKVLRLQLEVSQAKADMERRLQEKEEEFEATRYDQRMIALRRVCVKGSVDCDRWEHCLLCPFWRNKTSALNQCCPICISVL